MTPLEFIASLPHGEAKAAALTVYNLVTPAWVEITDDPATLPEVRKVVVIRMTGSDESPQPWTWFGWRDGCRWYFSRLAYWSDYSQSIELDARKECIQPTHWRPIG